MEGGGRVEGGGWKKSGGWRVRREGVIIVSHIPMLSTELYTHTCFSLKLELLTASRNVCTALS